MSGRFSVARLAAGCAAALAVCGLAAAEPAGDVGVPSCASPLALAVIDAALDRSAARIDREQPLTIVAMGSSSTKGAGASSPAMSYPSRLEAYLRQSFPRETITVLNRGVNGEEVREMLARFNDSVIAEK